MSIQAIHQATRQVITEMVRASIQPDRIIMSAIQMIQV